MSNNFDFGFDIDFNINEKTALITGAGRGIGKSIALLFAQKGADLILVGKSNNILDTATQCESLKRKCLPLVFDITETYNINKIIELGLKKFKKIDILVVYFINCVTYTHRQKKVHVFHPKIEVLQLVRTGTLLVHIL